MLKFFHRDSPASGSIHEEATISAVAPFMGVFNNLVLFNQHEKQNRLDLIEPELAESWSWNDDYTRLSFRLRQGVKWHDGKPFTAKDVKCTWDMLLGKSTESLRSTRARRGTAISKRSRPTAIMPSTFVLKRPQPAFLMLLATGMSPVYPCHVPPREMRTHPIGTGPFKFVEFKPNEYIKLTKNTDYWKPGRPYLDGIEWTVIPNRSTQTLAFIAGKFDMTFPYEATVQSMRDIQGQAPEAICELTPTPVAINLLVNRDAPPFDNPDIRRAMQLTHRPQELSRHPGRRPGRHQRRHAAAARRAVGAAAGDPGNPAGLWPRCRSQPRRGAQADGEARLRAGQPPRRSRSRPATSPQYRDPAVILIDQMKEIYIDGELDAVETANWFPKIARKDLHGRRQSVGHRGRRPGCLFLRALRLRLGAQLHQLLQPRA